VIGSLRGRLVLKQPPRLMLDVGGVGYELESPMSTFYRLPATGEDVMLVTHLVIRDDAHVLYGFHSEDERQLFRALLKVSGVGARIALGVLSGMSVQDFARCVVDKDLASLTRLPGVGRKTAERLLLEMPDRVPSQPVASMPADAGTAAVAQGALLALGYKPAEAVRMLEGLDASLGTEELIRQALKRVHTR
jgi:holliday junction DNA helicase RuvA